MKHILNATARQFLVTDHCQSIARSADRIKDELDTPLTVEQLRSKCFELAVNQIYLANELRTLAEIAAVEDHK